MSKWLSRTLLFVVFTVPAFGANLDLTPMGRSLQFNFSFPGARSLGMGGAFIGRADDASAAEANPAGLTVIARPEVTLEFRQLDFSEDIPLGVFGTSAALSERISSKHERPTFLSFVLPRRNMTFAVFYSRPLDYQLHLDTDQPGVIIGHIAGQDFYLGDPPGISSLNYKVETIGASGAWKFGGLSIGLGARHNRFKGLATFGNYQTATTGYPQAISKKLVGFGRAQGNSSKNSYSAGIKWANSSENLSLGAVYKGGVNDFEMTECNPNNLTDTCTSDPSAISNSFQLPTQYGAGISIRPAPGVTLNADLVHVQYGKLLRNYEPGLFCGAANVCKSGKDLGFVLDNVNEIHVGGEWAFPAARIPFALRAGWWHDPDHTLRYDGPATSTDPTLQAVEQFTAARYPGGKSQNHVAFGIGYISPSFEINAAYDHSSKSKTASLSALRRF